MLNTRIEKLTGCRTSDVSIDCDCAKIYPSIALLLIALINIALFNTALSFPTTEKYPIIIGITSKF